MSVIKIYEVPGLDCAPPRSILRLPTNVYPADVADLRESYGFDGEQLDLTWGRPELWSINSVGSTALAEATACDSTKPEQDDEVRFISWVATVDDMSRKMLGDVVWIKTFMCGDGGDSGEVSGPINDGDGVDRIQAIATAIPAAAPFLSRKPPIVAPPSISTGTGGGATIGGDSGCKLGRIISIDPVKLTARVQIFKLTASGELITSTDEEDIVEAQLF